MVSSYILTLVYTIINWLKGEREYGSQESQRTKLLQVGRVGSSYILLLTYNNLFITEIKSTAPNLDHT